MVVWSNAVPALQQPLLCEWIRGSRGNRSSLEVLLRLVCDTVLEKGERSFCREKLLLSFVHVKQTSGSPLQAGTPRRWSRSPSCTRYVWRPALLRKPKVPFVGKNRPEPSGRPFKFGNRWHRQMSETKLKPDRSICPGSMEDQAVSSSAR